MRIYFFKKLNCWKKIKKLLLWKYKITFRFPPDEKFGGVLQMRRAAMCMASNIAESTARNTNKDQAQFKNIVYGNTLEILNDLILIYELRFMAGKLLNNKQDFCRCYANLKNTLLSTTKYQYIKIQLSKSQSLPINFSTLNT